MASPVVTVVTPVRNGEAFLEACLGSVLAQSYQDFEYLVIDNASTDRTLEMARDLAAGDPRVRVIAEAEGVPQVANFNRALRRVAPASRYVKIVQADDWLYPECLAEMVELADSDPRIAIVGGLRFAGSAIKCLGLGEPGWRSQAANIEGREACRAYLLNGVDLFGSPTSLLYRADLVRGRPQFYPEGGLHEDSEVCYELLQDRRFGFVQRVLTFSRVGNESVSSPLRRFDPGYRGARLTMLHKFGRTYLTPTEFPREVRRVEADLYRYLAAGIGRADRAAFLDHYRTVLEGLGLKLDLRRILGARLRQLGWAAGNPLATLRGLLARSR